MATTHKMMLHISKFPHTQLVGVPPTSFFISTHKQNQHPNAPHPHCLPQLGHKFVVTPILFQAFIVTIAIMACVTYFSPSNFTARL